MRSLGNRIVSGALLAIVAWFGSFGTVRGATLEEALAERGHPETRMCRIDGYRGLGELMVIQYPSQPSEQADEQKAIAILRLLASALEHAGQRYVGFRSHRTWNECRNGSPGHVFWRDHENGWRYVQGHPARYLPNFLDELPPELRHTPAHAYVAWSLAIVEQRRGRIRQSVALLEEAYELLEASDDPNGILGFTLVPLIHHYLGEGADDDKGQAYLDAYALVAESTPGDDNHLPLIKVAPVYPVDAYRAGQEGYVLLEFSVNDKGRVVNPVVVEESPDGVFVDAAIKAALDFRYIPRVVDGTAVSTDGVRNLITFEIQ